MTTRRRLVALLSLLVACAALVGYDRLRPDTSSAGVAGVVEPAPHTRPVPALDVPRVPPKPQITALRPRSDFIPGGRDAFAGVKRVVAAPVPVAPPAPAAVPTAPALPFTVIGKKFERGTWEVYLAKGDASYIATAGTVLDGEYRVVEIAPPVMTLVYLPLNEKQTLQVGASLHD
jgi:hypothetical protein